MDVCMDGCMHACIHPCIYAIACNDKYWLLFARFTHTHNTGVNHIFDRISHTMIYNMCRAFASLLVIDGLDTTCDPCGTVNPRTKNLHFRGFDSNMFLILRGGVPRWSMGSFPEIQIQRFLIIMWILSVWTGRKVETAPKRWRTKNEHAVVWNSTKEMSNQERPHSGLEIPSLRIPSLQTDCKVVALNKCFISRKFEHLELSLWVESKPVSAPDLWTHYAHIIIHWSQLCYTW